VQLPATRRARPAPYCGQLVLNSRTASTLRADAVDGDPEYRVPLIWTICVA